MQAHPIPIHMPIDRNSLLDEEFDHFDIKQPFNRKPIREQTALLCDGGTWDESFDSNDMLCELQE